MEVVREGPAEPPRLNGDEGGSRRKSTRTEKQGTELVNNHQINGPFAFASFF